MSNAPGPETERIIIRRACELEGADASPSLAAELDRLFAAHEARIYRLCCRMTGNPEQARELTQESLLVAWRSIDRFDGEARFGTWIYGIARNLCLNSLRRRGELLTADGVLEVGSPEADALSQLQSAEREALLSEVTAGLTAEEQEAIWLRYVEGIGQDDITRILELSGSGARGLLQRCRRHLEVPCPA
jgi:RNA polymerase sigma-70 factor (ECF subfamily)